MSMSRVGGWLDNTMVERFFATLQAAPVDTRIWTTGAAAQQVVFE